MKTKILLPVMFLFFIGVSCSIEDDSGNINSVEAHLLGKWDLEGHTVNGDFQEASEESILEFRRDGVIVGHSAEGEVTGSYTLSGNQIALNFPNGGDIFTIETLNITTLNLFNEEEFDDDPGLDAVLYQFRKLPN